MKSLPYDIARCKPEKAGCKIKYNCARFTSSPNPEQQSYIDASAEKAETGHCEYFIYNEA